MVEGARLEILCTPCGYRGFKSLPLRQLRLNKEALKSFDFEVFCFGRAHADSCNICRKERAALPIQYAPHPNNTHFADHSQATTRPSCPVRYLQAICGQSVEYFWTISQASASSQTHLRAYFRHSKRPPQRKTTSPFPPDFTYTTPDVQVNNHTIPARNPPRLRATPLKKSYTPFNFRDKKRLTLAFL